MDQVEQIRERVNIVELISETIPLKKAGRNFKGLCPFHGEKTPSFVVSPERQIWHCFGCFPPGEKVKTPFGYHNIEDLDINHWVVSGKGNLQRITSTMTHIYDGELIGVRLRKLDGIVRMTSDHTVYAIRGAPYTQKKYKDFSKRYRKYLKLRLENQQKYEELVKKHFPIKEIRAGELQKGDLLLYPIRRVVSDLKTINLRTYLTKSIRYGPAPKHIPLEIPVHEDLLKLIGYYIAEGSNHRAYIRFSLGNHEEDFAEEIVRLIAKIFSLNATIHRRSQRNKTGIEVTSCHAHLANILENLCGKGASNKHIPFIFQDLPVAKQRILLQAIFKGDGTTFKGNKSNKLHKSIRVISRILSEQLIDILLRSRIFPTHHVEKAKVDKLHVKHKEIHSLFWSEEAAQRYDLIYYSDDGTEYWLLPIINLIRKYYTGPVYNLTVDNDHSYVATNFTVANCGKGGDAFTFLMELERIEFPEALRILAERAGVKLEAREVSDEKTQLRERLLAMHQLAGAFYHYLLTEHRLGRRGMTYLKERGMTDKLIKTFNLGFAPNAWENLVHYLSKKGFKPQELELAGLAIRGRSGWYDRFRGRIMFPLKSYRGTTIAFSGRLLEVNAKEAKYINSPETALYTKGDVFYGLDVTKEAIRKAQMAVIVEGEFDLISSFAAGITNVVAIKGSALTEAQVNLIKRFAERIILALDQDVAGDAASRRGIEIADQAGLDTRVAAVPVGKDPDEAARENPTLWQHAVKQAVPFYDFLLSSAIARFGTEESFSKKKVSDEVLPAIAKIDNPIVQAHYVRLIAQKLEVAEEKVHEALTRLRTRKTSVGRFSVQTNVAKSPSLSPEQYLLALVLQALDLKRGLDLVSAEIDPSDFEDAAVKRIFMSVVDFLAQKESLTVAELGKILPQELLATFDQAFLVDLSDFTTVELWQKELVRITRQIKRNWLRHKIKSLTQQIGIENANHDQIQRLQQELQVATSALKRLI